MLAWHFLKNNCRCGYGSLGVIKPGQTVKLKPGAEPILCRRGFHASKRLLDALFYAPGDVLCRVKLGGKIINGDDKVVASERTVIWMGNVEEILFHALLNEYEATLIKDLATNERQHETLLRTAIHLYRISKPRIIELEKCKTIVNGLIDAGQSNAQLAYINELLEDITIRLSRSLARNNILRSGVITKATTEDKQQINIRITRKITTFMRQNPV